MKKITLLIILVANFIVTNAQVQPRLVLPVGHTKSIRLVSLSKDGRYIASASKDATIKIWEVTSGKELHTLFGHLDAISSVSFSEDGKYLFSCSYDHTARVWDVFSGNELHKLQFASNIVTASFNKGGNYILTLSEDSVAKLWDFAKGKELHKLQSNLDKVISASFSQDGKYIITALSDSTARIWDIASRKETQKLLNTNNFESVSFSEDGKYILTITTVSDDTSETSYYGVWEVANGKELYKLRHNKFLSMISSTFSSDGRYMMDAVDNFVKIWEVASGKVLHILQHTDVLESSSFSPDGKFILTRSIDNTLRIWDVSNGKELRKIEDKNEVISEEFSRDGKYLFSVLKDRTIKIWDVKSGKNLQEFMGYSLQQILPIISENNKYVVSQSEDCLDCSSRGSARIWELETGKKIHRLGHSSWVNSANFSTDGKYVITSSDDSSARIWDVVSGNEIHRLGHSSSVNSANFSTDGKYVITSSDDSTARIWEVESGKEFHTLRGHIDIVNLASFSADGKYVVTASYDNTARIWDVKSGNNLQILKGHTGEIRSVSFSTDGKYLVTASYDSSVRVWEVSKGKELYKLMHSNLVASASFSSDGKYVVSASWDHTSKIWDVANGKELQILLHSNLLGSASFSKDGKYIITNGLDHNTIIWDPSTGKQLYTRLQLINDDWLVYDEDNHFDGSEGAINYLYLTCGLEVIDLTQVKDSLWIPGLAGKIMRGEKLLINDKPAPKLSDLNICELTPLVEELPKDVKGNLAFQITPRNGELGETEVYINGNLTYKYQPNQLTPFKNKEGKLIYTLHISKDSITPFLSGDSGSVNPVLVKCKIKGASIYSRGAEVEMVTEKDPELPKLYAVFVGVNDYNNPQKESNEFLYRNLDYAAKDAGDLANMVEHSAHTLFKDSAFIYRLTGKPDTEPTKDNLKKVLAEIGAKAKANDILYIFFAGHGDIVKTKEEKNEIRFMLQGAEKRNKNTGGFGVEELTDWCAPKNLKAQKRVFVFDACHSGQFVNETMAYAQGGRGDEEEVRIRQLTSLKDKNGMMILAASSDNESAYEDPSLNQGVLTYHLLEAVKDSKDSTLQINKWFESTLDLVKEYATANNRKQTPETFGNGRFEIGNVNDQVRAGINIGAPKPRVGISTFIDPTGDADKKYPNLEKLVNEHFKQSGSRGNFISATNNEKAYYAKGSVLLDNNKLKVRYSLYYGDTPIAEPFSMNEMKGLIEEDVVAKIIASVEDRIYEYIKKSKK